MIFPGEASERPCGNQKLPSDATRGEASRRDEVIHRTNAEAQSLCRITAGIEQFFYRMRHATSHGLSHYLAMCTAFCPILLMDGAIALGYRAFVELNITILLLLLTK